MHISPRLVRWLVPSLPVLLGSALFLTLLAQPWRTMMTLSDADGLVWWATGNWMLDHGQVLRADPFSHTRLGAPVITKEWLSNLAYAVAGNAGGLYGLALLAAGLIAATFALLLRQLLRDDNDPLFAVLLTLLGVWVATMHFLARPHLFSFLFLVVAHAILRHRQGSALVIGLAALTLLWVNTHGGFLMLFFLTGAYWLGAVFERDWSRLRLLTVAGAVCAAVSLANPNGWALHRHLQEFLGSKYMTGWIVEFASPDFHSPGARGLLVWLALLWGALALLRPRLRAGDRVALVVWTYFALHSRRNTPLLVLVSLPVLAPVLTHWVRQRWPRRAGLPATNGWAWALAAVALAVAWPRPIDWRVAGWPLDAVAHVRQQPREFTGNVFNQYVWGSYLVQALPERRVFIDSRQDFYGEALLREFDAVTGLRTNWTTVLDKYAVGWTLMPTDHRLNVALTLASNTWRLAYRDDVATIFTRRPAP